MVGNDAYTDQSVLWNAVKAARAVASALGEVGFAVTWVENADRARLMSALSAFARSLRSDDVALFHFAGHGVQVDQENYLMPTDYTGPTASALRFDAVSASDVRGPYWPARATGPRPPSLRLRSSSAILRRRRRRRPCPMDRTFPQRVSMTGSKTNRVETGLNQRNDRLEDRLDQRIDAVLLADRHPPAA